MPRRSERFISSLSSVGPSEERSISDHRDEGQLSCFVVVCPSLESGSKINGEVFHVLCVGEREDD
jgi:hypothetical protein